MTMKSPLHPIKSPLNQHFLVKLLVTARWCPQDSVQLVYNSNFTMVFVGDISIVFICIHGVYKPINITFGGHHLVVIDPLVIGY